MNRLPLYSSKSPWIKTISCKTHRGLFGIRISLYLDLCMNFGQFQLPLLCTLNLQIKTVLWLANIWNVIVILFFFCCCCYCFVPTSAHLSLILDRWFVQIYLNASRCQLAIEIPNQLKYFDTVVVNCKNSVKRSYVNVGI